MDNFSNMQNMNTNVKSRGDKGKKLKIGLVCTSVLAVAGIGFGIWGVYTVLNPKCEEGVSSSSKVDSNNGEVSKIEEEEASETSEVAESANTTSATDGYLTFPEWGIKIKIPDGFDITGTVRKYAPAWMNGSVAFTGNPSGSQYLPEYSNIDKCQLGWLTAYSDYDENAPSAGDREKVFEHNGFTFVYEGPQAVCTTQASEKDGEISAANTIKEMLKNNISEL